MSRLSAAPAAPQDALGSATSPPPLVSVPSFPLTSNYYPRMVQTSGDTDGADIAILRGRKPKERRTEGLFSKWLLRLLLIFLIFNL